MSLEINIKNSLTRIATEFKTVKTIISGNSSGSLSALTTTQKTSLVAAVNELKAMVDAVSGGGAGDLLSANNLSDIANAATALANLGGLNQAQVDARVQQIVGAAPAALDTLAEFATALGNDANFASTVTAALANRVRFDASQTLTEPQKTQARSNIGAAATVHSHDSQYYTKAEIGDPAANLVTHFESGLV